jgi:hypothetical protein
MTDKKKRPDKSPRRKRRSTKARRFDRELRTPRTQRYLKITAAVISLVIIAVAIVLQIRWRKALMTKVEAVDFRVEAPPEVEVRDLRFERFVFSPDQTNVRFIGRGAFRERTPGLYGTVVRGTVRNRSETPFFMVDFEIDFLSMDGRPLGDTAAYPLANLGPGKSAEFKTVPAIIPGHRRVKCTIRVVPRSFGGESPSGR